MPTAEAMAAWFGLAAACRLAGDPEACRGALDRDIAAIDALLAEQIDAILHHPRAAAFEGRWRGRRLARRRARSGRAGKAEDPASSVERALPRPRPRRRVRPEPAVPKVYESEFGMPGGEPYGLLVVDHEIRHRPAAGAPTDDVNALLQLSGVAAAAFVPTVLGASPSLLQVDDFADLAMVAELQTRFAARSSTAGAACRAGRICGLWRDAAARARPSALGRRPGARRRLPLRRICSGLSAAGCG